MFSQQNVFFRKLITSWNACSNNFSVVIVIHSICVYIKQFQTIRKRINGEKLVKINKQFKLNSIFSIISFFLFGRRWNLFSFAQQDILVYIFNKLSCIWPHSTSSFKRLQLYIGQYWVVTNVFYKANTNRL